MENANDVIIIKRWISTCLNQHHQCNATRGIYLPNRLIDVGSVQPTREPKLVTREEATTAWQHRTPGWYREMNAKPTDISMISFPPYISLSHCWGKRTHLVTKVKTIEERRKAIPLASLDQTYQEAIRITRALGIAYIWTDSLCIIQDSTSDWEKECAAMAWVYTNATLNLAAYVYDPSFRPSWNDRLRGEISYAQNRDDYRSIGLLATRGWVLQERLLTPAVITIGSTDLDWHCRCAEFSFSNPKYNRLEFFSRQVLSSTDAARFTLTQVGNFLARMAKINNNHSLEPLHTVEIVRYGNQDVFIEPKSVYVMWRTLIEHYSKLQLTFESDKLPAIAGLTTLFARFLEDEFLAGIWSSDLPLSLMWRSVGEV